MQMRHRRRKKLYHLHSIIIRDARSQDALICIMHSLIYHTLVTISTVTAIIIALLFIVYLCVTTSIYMKFLPLRNPFLAQISVGWGAEFKKKKTSSRRERGRQGRHGAAGHSSCSTER